MKVSGPPLLLGALFLLAGCAGPAWYVQAVAGHVGLMCKRQEVAAILADADTDEALRGQLLLAREIRSFASARLYLPDNGSYLDYVATGRDAVTWNVVAAPEFALEPRRWCFLFAGCVPYRGYFDPSDADRLADRLAGRGFDVTVSPALAYSTLGWFRDPLLDTMFRYRQERLAAVIFHELAHQQLYVRGDTAFSESYASFMEDIGVRLWLEHSGRSDRLPAWRRQQEADQDFAALLRQTRDELELLYASPAGSPGMRAAKAAAFGRLRERYSALVRDRWRGEDHFGYWFEQGPNNAHLALFDSYVGGTCVFAALYRAAGQDVARFQALAAERAALEKAARRAWLNQPCPAVAPGADL